MQIIFKTFEIAFAVKSTFLYQNAHCDTTFYFFVIIQMKSVQKSNFDRQTYFNTF